MGSSGGGGISGIDNQQQQKNSFNASSSVKYEVDEFEEQPEVSYEEALDMLLNDECCFGLYDFKIEQWRTAVYVRQFDNTRRLSVRYTQDNSKGMNHPNINAEKFCTIKEFPSKCIQKDSTRFVATLRDLTDQSNVPKEKIEAWKKRQKDSKYQKMKKQEKIKKEKEAKEKKEKEKLEKEEKAKKE